jgi:hypothetical protein
MSDHLTATSPASEVLPLEAVERLVCRHACMAQMLYHVLATASPKRRRDYARKGRPEDLELEVVRLGRASSVACLPWLTHLRAVHDGRPVDGWGLSAPSAVEAAQHFSGRVLMEYARLRGEPIANVIGEPAFDRLPPPPHGWLEALVQQEFATLRARGAPAAPAGPHLRPIDREILGVVAKADKALKAVAVQRQCPSRPSADYARRRLAHLVKAGLLVKGVGGYRVP